MDPRYGSLRAVDAVDPTSSYDSCPVLPSTRPESRRFRLSPCCRHLSWTAVSILEIVITIVMVVFYFFWPKQFSTLILPAATGERSEINEFSEWILRKFASMVCVQITLLIAGIGWGDTTSRKIIYWGMLTGDILLIAIQSAFVHSMSEWHAINITIVTMASAFGLFRIITLIFNPSWWLWVPEPNF